MRLTPTVIKPLAMAGPYKTIVDSCAAARPCGFTDMDANGNYTTPAKTPDCDAVLDPSRDPIGVAMDEFSGPGVDPKMLSEPDCKLGGSATSLTEKWPSDEVILSGGTGTGGPVDTTIQIGVDAPLAAPGRYRFVR